jgi:APA family basic amino acid/polyamine antiporter
VSTGTVNYGDTFNHGWLGVLRGASVVFFAFIGFDAVSTAAQEAKNPQKDMPKGILISLVICTALIHPVFARFNRACIIQRIPDTR